MNGQLTISVETLQGFLLVSEREWIDLGIYCRKLPLVTRRVLPDRDYIANLKGEIDRATNVYLARIDAAASRPAPLRRTRRARP